MSLTKATAGAATAWDLATALLRYWIANGPATSPRNGNDPLAYRRWSQHETHMRREFIAHIGGDGVVSAPLLTSVIRHTSDGDDLEAVHAAAWALSYANSLSFAASWRDGIASDEVLLGDGDLFPCCDAPWPWIADGRRKPLSRPASVTNSPDDQLPHVRRFSSPVIDGREVQVCVDFSLEGQLLAVLEAVTLAAGVHPNDSISEFDMPGHPSCYPIEPADPQEQAALVHAGLTRALEAGAGVIVLPELSVGSELLEEIAARLDDLDDDCLVVAGSRHHVSDGARVNDATGLLPDQASRLLHRKAVRFTSELGGSPGTREGIDRTSPIRLRLYQAGPYRLAMPICKDFLDASFAGALVHTGTNVVLVPSMSPKSDGFVPRALQLLGDAQALTIMVCGPLRWGSERPSPIALRAQPAGDAVLMQQREPVERMTWLPIG